MDKEQDIFLKHINYYGRPMMRRYNNKGFVYSNICHQVSNFMTENVFLFMQINHKENICFRDKPSSKCSKYNYTETKFGNYKGYLFTIKDDLHETKVIKSGIYL